MFVGTCAARLAEFPPEGPEAERQAVAGAIGALLEANIRGLKQTEGKLPLRVNTEWQDILFREGEKLLKEYDVRWPTPQLDRVNLSILQLQQLSCLADRLPNEARNRLGLAVSAEQMLRALPVTLKVLAESLSQLTLHAGTIALKLGDTGSAISLFTRSVKAAEEAGESAATAASRLGLCDALRRGGRVEEAMEQAMKADAVFASEPFPSVKRLASLGRLTQLSIALQNYSDAIKHASEGFALATKLDDLQERAAYKGDEARALLKLKSYDEALIAATKFGELARLAYNAEAELCAQGVVVEALIGKHEYGKALDLAETGLARSRALGQMESIGDFLRDIAEIKSLTGKHQEALDCAMEAAPIFARVGYPAKVRNVLALANDICRALARLNSGANASDASFKIVKTQIAVVDLVDRDLRRAITMDIITRIKALITRAGIAPVDGRVQELASYAESLASLAPAQRSEQFEFIKLALQMFRDIGANRINEACQTAEHLDALSNGGFQLGAFVQTCTIQS